jgi:predicted phage terminase large subunit-like protein
VVDDADSKKLAKNQVRTKEAVDWIKGDFLGCLSIKGETFIYANNRVAKNGITAHMVGDIDETDPKNEGIQHIKVFALENAKHEMAAPGDPDARPAWKERYTYDDIIRRMNKMGYRNSMRQFFHKHIEDGNIFTDVHIVWSDMAGFEKYEALLTYLDPSFKDTKKNDYKAIVLVGRTGKYYDVLWCWIRQTTKSNMVKAHYDIHEELEEYFSNLPARGPKDPERPAVQHYMEANFIQDIMLEEYDEEGEQRGYQLRIRKDTRAKPDKFGRIEDLEPLMARGLVRFNAKLKKSADMQTLKDQFLAFPNGHDDGPDAVEGAIYKLGKKTKQSKTTSRMGKYARNSKRAA